MLLARLSDREWLEAAERQWGEERNVANSGLSTHLESSSTNVSPALNAAPCCAMKTLPCAVDEGLPLI